MPWSSGGNPSDVHATPKHSTREDQSLRHHSLGFFSKQLVLSPGVFMKSSPNKFLSNVDKSQRDQKGSVYNFFISYFFTTLENIIIFLLCDRLWLFLWYVSLCRIPQAMPSEGQELIFKASILCI